MTASRSCQHVDDPASSSQPFRKRVVRTLLVSAVVCWGALAFLGPAPVHAQSKSPSPSKRIEIPASLPKIGELGENVYDLAKARDWTKTAEKLAALEDAVKGLAADSAAARADKDRLKAHMAALGKAVTAKDRQAAMREANRVTLIAANLTEPFDPKVPVDVTRLDYYGRELEVWAAAGDKDRLKATATAMRKTWDRLRPAVVAHKGAAEAKQVDELMAQVEAAKSSREYGLVATPVLEAVDQLEKVFK